MPILETSQLSRTFGELLAVDSVSFAVDFGEVFGLLLIGARNIALRTLLLRQDWMSTGVLSVRPGDTSPDTPDREAKAARLRRYAELRWSPGASPCLKAGSN